MKDPWTLCEAAMRLVSFSDLGPRLTCMMRQSLSSSSSSAGGPEADGGRTRVSTLAATSQPCKHHNLEEAVQLTSGRPDLATPLNMLTRCFRVIVDE